MSKEFISGAESFLDFFVKKLTMYGGICADCKKNLGDLCEMLKERTMDKRLEKLESELEL